MSQKPKQSWVPWALLGVGIVVVIAVISALTGGDDDGGGGGYPPIDWAATPERPTSVSDDRQTYYNAYLRVARQQLRETGGDIYCEPDYWYLVASQVEGADAGQRVLMQSSMADACKEGGHLSGAAQYSSYYADAP